MKSFVFSLIVLVSLAFSNVSYALPNVNTEKADTELKAVVLENQADVLGVYEIVKTNAPEVFTEDAGGTKVTLYGKYKDEAYKFLTEQKNGKNIYTGTDCYSTENLAVSICKSDHKNTLKAENTRDQNLTNSGQINSISKKWVRYV